MSYLGLAWAQVRTRLPALAAAMAVVALGVALAAGMLLANDALREGVARSTGAISGSADVTVRALADGTIAQALIAEIEAVEGVSAAVPVLVTSAVPQAGGRGTGESLQLIGVDLLDDAMVRVYRSDRTPGEAAGIEDPLLFLNQPGSAIAPRAFLERHGLARDARFPVRTSGAPAVVAGLAARAARQLRPDARRPRSGPERVSPRRPPARGSREPHPGRGGDPLRVTAASASGTAVRRHRVTAASARANPGARSADSAA